MVPPKPTKAQLVQAIKDGYPAVPRRHIGSNRPEGLIWVKNTSSETIDRFGILGIDSILIKPSDNLDFFKQTFALKGVKPKADKHTGKFVICNVPLAPNASGPAFIFGICPVQTDVLATVGDRLDVLDDNPNFLTKAGNGAVEVLYAGNASGGDSADHWALVRFGNAGGAQRYKVHTLPDPVSGVVPCWAKCHTWDGTTEGTGDIAIRLVFPHQPGDKFYAIDTAGGTGQMDDSMPDHKEISFVEVQTWPTGWNCTLTRDDGGGTPIAAPTYTVKTTDGSATLSTTDSPLLPRWDSGYVNVGENGFGFFGDDGVFVLQYTDETADEGAC